jgi:hypothetical protein
MWEKRLKQEGVMQGISVERASAVLGFSLYLSILKINYFVLRCASLDCKSDCIYYKNI